MDDDKHTYRKRIITFIEYFGSDENFKKVIMVHNENEYAAELDELIQEQFIEYKDDIAAHVITEKGKEYTESHNITWLEL